MCIILVFIYICQGTFKMLFLCDSIIFSPPLKILFSRLKCDIISNIIMDISIHLTVFSYNIIKIQHSGENFAILMMTKNAKKAKK